MEQQEIDDIVSVAEFMDLQPVTYSTTNIKCLNPKHMDGTRSPIQFHSSWDWLMPVYLKANRDIREVWDNVEGLEKIILYKLANKLISCVGIYGMDTTLVLRTDEEVIKDTYNTVVEFVKWYNEQTI